MLHLLFFNLLSIVVDFHTYLLFLFLQSNPDPLYPALCAENAFIR